jgi:predicted lactoylglutathione lyase
MGQEFHRGRLLDHVHLHVRSLKLSVAFYKAVLNAIGKGDLLQEGDGHFFADELYIDADPKAKSSPVHIAFQAADEETVRRFHDAGIKAGGRDNGAPGPRPQYHPGYYAAFVIDPDGNNIEAVFHGANTRSADSVVIKPA